MKMPLKQTYIDLKSVLSSQRFPRNNKIIEDLLDRAFQEIETKIDKPYFLHSGTRPTKNGYGTDLPKGQRDETMLRNYLIAKLFEVWRLAYDEVPEINNKNYPDTKFVVFAGEIFNLLGIGKVIDHLEEFQSYRKAILKNSNLE